MDMDEIAHRLDDCITLAGDPNFTGIRWLTELSSTFWDGKGDRDWAEIYHPLIRMLFNEDEEHSRSGVRSSSTTSPARPMERRPARDLVSSRVWIRFGQ